MKSVKNVVNTGEIKTYLLKSMVKRSKIIKQAFALIEVYIVKYIEKEGDLMKRKNKKSFNWYGLKQRFSIRKYHFGAASVLIGTTMFLMGGPTTQAAETGTQIVQSTDSSSTGKSAEDVTNKQAETPAENATNKQAESQAENTSNKQEGTSTETVTNKQDEAQADSSSSSTSTPEVTAKEKVDTTSNGSNEVITQPKEENQEEKVQEEKSTATVSTDALRTYLDELKNLLKEVPDSLKEKVENQEKVAEKTEKILDSETSTQQEVDEQVAFVRTSINSLKKLKENNWGLDSKDKAEDKSEKETRNPKERSANITPKEKLEKLSQNLNAYFKFASEITRPETKELIKGTEDIIRSVNEGLQQPDLTDEKIQSLIEQGKQAERKLALAVTRENSGKRDIINGTVMERGADFRANPTGLDTKRAYIVQKDDGTNLPPETYLYAMRRTLNDKRVKDSNLVDVSEAYDEAKVSVEDKGDGNYRWTITFNSGFKSHQNAFYWFTLPKNHKITQVLGITKTMRSGSSSSIGAFNFDGEWTNKIKQLIGNDKKAVNGPAKGGYDFNTDFRSLKDVTNSEIAPKVGGGARVQNDNPVDSRNAGGYYYLGPVANKFNTISWGTEVPDAVREKAARNMTGMHENTETLYHFTHDDGKLTFTYETHTDYKYAPLYYAAGMRTLEDSSAKQYFMARGLQEKPNAPTVTPNSEGAVTVTPYSDSDQNKNVDKVDLTYTNTSGAKKTVTLTRNPKNGTWTSSENGADEIQINGNSFSLKAGSVQVGTEVTAKSYFGNSDASDERKQTIHQRTEKPNVTANQDGSVTVTPSRNADYLTVKYIDEVSKASKTITATKNSSTWSVKGDPAILIDNHNGVVTIPANSVEDNSTVEAQDQAKAADEFMSEKATARAKNQDRTAPTIRVRKNGTNTWLTPDSTGKVVVVATPDRNNVEIDVDIKDEANGSGYEFSSNGTNPTATKTVENSTDYTDYNENSTTYSAWGKAADATAKLTVGLKSGKTTTDFSGITMKLNAKDKAGNITSAINKKEVTVKIVSAKPTYPPRVTVLNPTNIQETEKDKILKAIKEANKTNEANPTFTKESDGIKATYTDGTTYKVPYSEIVTYNYVATKKTINVGENPNWGSPKQYFTYEDGGAIGDDKTFLWKGSSTPMTAPNNPDLTVGTNKTVEVLAPDPEGGNPKILTLTYDVVDNQPPKVKINGVELGENVDQNPRFVIYRGAEFNPTFEVEDNSGKTTYLKASDIPSGVWFNKQQNGHDVEKTDMANNAQYTLTTNNIVDNNNTLGEHTASVTVKDASRNEKTYQFKYVIVDIEARNTPETVPLNTKLVDPADKDHAKDSHNYVKVSDGNAQKPNGDDDYYTTGMSFTWSKNNTPITNKTLLSTPGVVEYTAVVTFPNNGATYSKTVDGKTVTVYPPKKDTVSVTFKVKPTAPTVTPDNNGDVRVGHTNETNVSRMEVTYTPADKNRLEDNGTVTKTAQDRTTVIATKGSNNQWSITSGAKEGISVNTTTGEITLKDQVVKDKTKIQAKVVAQEVPSDENGNSDSKDGDRTNPTIGLGNTLVGVRKEFNLSLGLSDKGVGIDDSNIKVTLPAGVSGLTYDATTKSIKGTLSSAAKHEVKVTVLDKNGNKAEKTISIAAVKPKPIYEIKDGTINNVDTPSHFVEVPAGVTLTSASWKNGQPTTTTVGNATKTVTVNANGYDATEVDVPVTVYPKVTYRKVGGEEVKTYYEIVGQPLTSRLVSGGGTFNPVTPDYYIAFEGGAKPDGTRVEFEGGTPPERSTTAGVTTKTIKVTYPDGKVTVEKTVTFKTYGNEVNYETGKDSIETIVGTSVTARNAVKLSNPNLPNPSGTAFVWWKNNGQYTPDNKIGKHTENANAWYGRTVMNARGDSTNNYNNQDITVNITVKPQAPTIAENALYGKGTTKPNVTVGNLPTNNQLETGATVTVELYSGDKKVASKTVNGGTTSVEFSKNDYTDNLTYSEKVHAVVKVAGGSGNTAYDLSSANSNDVQVTPQKPTFDTATVTSTSRTLSGTLGGFDDSKRVVEVHLNDENNTVLSSANPGEVTITGDKWTATLPDTVKLRQSVTKNGETTKPSSITVENKVANTTISTTSDEKEVSMGTYSVTPTIAGSKHIDITVPHDAKRVELRFHNSTETGDKPNSITLVRGTDGTWHTEATRAENATVTDANGYVGRITSTVSTTNPSENIISIPLNEQNGANKLHLKEEEANGDNTATYGKGLGLRVDYQPEAGQDPTAVGNWKVVSVTNTAPTINVKGDTGKDATHRKVYDSGTTLTADVLKDLVTVTDAEDGRATESEKPYGTGNVKVVSGLPATTGTTPAGVYEVTLTAVDSQGKEGNQVKVHVAVKEAKPTAPTVGQWQNGNLKVTPATTNSGDKITIPLKSGNVVVTKDAQNGWQVTGQPNGVSVHNGSIEISRNLVNTTVTATASKGEGDVKAVSDPGTHTLTTHEVTKADIIKKPKESLSGTDLYSVTGITGVVENGVRKTYQNAGINSVTSDGQLPELEADTEKQVSVVITYNDGSKEKTTVTLKVAPAAPNVTVNPQNAKTGDVTLTIKRHNDTNYLDGSVVTVPGIGGTFKVKDGTITIKNEQLKDKVQTGKVAVKEEGKLLVETEDNKVIPAQLKDGDTATIKFEQDPTTGEVTVTVSKANGGTYATGTKVTVPGINNETFPVGENGTFKIPNNKLPETATSGSVGINEPGHKPASVAGQTTPAQLVPSATPTFTVGTQDKLDGHVDVTVTGVPDGTKVTLPGVSEPKTVENGKVVLTNDELPEKETKGKGSAQEGGKLPTEGTSEIIIPGKLTSAKGAPAIEFRVKLPLPLVVPDPEHLTPTEIAELVKRVKEANNDEANPDKEVTVDDKGNVTVTDKNTGESALLLVEDLTVKDFTPVKPTKKVPAKDILHLTPEEKKQVEDKVKAKNPGKEVTVGEDGTATVTDPNTGVSHEIPGKDLVVKDFTPVKPDEKVPVKDKTHLTPEEKKQVEDKVKAKNPGKEVTVGEDGTATVTDPTTGVSHIIPGSDLTIAVGNDTTENNRPEDARPDQLPATPEVPDNNGQDTPAVTPSNDDTANNSDAITPSDDVADTENTQVRPHRSQDILPNTGTVESAGFLSAAASMIAGLGFLIPFGKRRKKEEGESQND